MSEKEDSEDDILVVRKENTRFDAGYFYCPYVPTEYDERTRIWFEVEAIEANNREKLKKLRRLPTGNIDGTGGSGGDDKDD